ncbi:high affinity cGMP-specific 3',5'-cyclic phosphodiesterase 9A-like isoform X2 [Lingula anatina]|uniref:Phosphodiesterase n=1 Tax=Lingula anatina TaxID=7574 RepID=A0A1S3JYL5_LINAN|nr:high affinity cGMP-specific 3',5'-cyclic phosphodiesterase 9A-like isoform X2 [Lingula anatina]|eukprot:XP_013415515.1 high affinity cGMP-specific 3',5'-cyclic phosphodiesterase 9A-like isoform X2 [Lingula anatina]
MATKVIYFTVAGKEEQAEFRSTDNQDDVRDIFRAAAEAGPHDILKLYNTKGNLINISSKLEQNTPESRYKLDVVAAQCTAEQLGFNIHNVESRLQNLEKKILVDKGDTPSLVYDIRHKVEEFRERLEHVDHLSWLGLSKDISVKTSLKPFWDKNNSPKQNDAHYKRIFEKFKKMSTVQVTDEVRDYLKKPTFDNWQWDDAEMLILLQQMYIDLGFLTKFNIELSVLQHWLFEVYRHYNPVPFHNFKHCFMVAQMMYGMTWLIDLSSYIDDLEVLVLITSAICHDLGHPGYNNAYQINARTELALRYNDISPLENHHCSVAFEILEKNNANIFRNVPVDTFKRIREGMIKCILATDMAKHSEIVNNFKSLIPNFDFKNKEHKSLLMMILIKVADISNEARPLEVAEPWLDCLLTEFFTQSDVEKLEGLPVAPFMDREKVTKSSSQMGFIKYVLLPLFEALGELFPCIEEQIIEPVRIGLKYYTDMHSAQQEELIKRRGSRELTGELTDELRSALDMPKIEETEIASPAGASYSKPENGKIKS